MDIKPFGQNISNITKNQEDKKNTPFGDTVSELAKAKHSLNKSILESTININVEESGKSLNLLLNRAIENINAELEGVMGENAIQNAYESGLDVSPEATAERIVSLSTGFFAAYKGQHPEMNDEEALKSFVNVISGGIDKGFAEAREILDGLQVLEGDIATNIDKTYDIVQEKLQAFLDNSLKS